MSDDKKTTYEELIESVEALAAKVDHLVDLLTEQNVSYRDVYEFIESRSKGRFTALLNTPAKGVVIGFFCAALFAVLLFWLTLYSDAESFERIGIFFRGLIANYLGLGPG